MWKSIARGFVDLVAPRHCPGCDTRLPEDTLSFCDACAPLVEPCAGPACFEYGGPLADAIRRLKYEARVDLVEPLGALWVKRGMDHAGQVDVVVPMPVHPRRLRKRRLDWVALLAEPLAEALGIPLDTQRLSRVRDTRVQASLPQAAREMNVRGAFEARRDDKRRRVLLVDDVRTTGATMRAATGALYRAGASRVRVMALAGVLE
ncbi:MAG: putative amidophosphoribosyltransferase [Polyangiales bacterium]|jgi:predicted amidophosphoribosyltransferase